MPPARMAARTRRAAISSHAAASMCWGAEPEYDDSTRTGAERPRRSASSSADRLGLNTETGVE